MTPTPTDDMRSELLSCPFCEGKATLHDRSHWASPPFTVYCQHCSFDIWPHDTADKAIAAWNTRPVPAGVVAIREALVTGFVYADDAGKLLEITGHRGSTEQKADVAKIKAAIELCDALVKAHAQPAPDRVSLNDTASKVDAGTDLQENGYSVKALVKLVLEAAGVAYVE